jgi:hypothetical protein
MVAELMFKALKAWYKDGQIHMILSDRKEVIFPVDVNKKLREATPEQLSKLKLICNGTGLHWPDLDEDLSVTGILEGRYGKND